MDDYILVGRVTGAHGIRGAVKIHSYAESMALFAAGEKLRLTFADGTSRTMMIEWARPHGRGFRMGLETVTDRTQAESLAGASIFVERSRLPVLEADTYYWFELVGLNVYDTTGQLLGCLDEVIPTAANDVYVVTGEVDGQPREMLIPAVARVIRSIDLENRTMVVDPPEGL
ncbi:Ribosome maturation factor RimM [Desulfosarcina cetonica]|uniref:ribosome maturation factor RimM n=1 Tax=Desulfosarcina cetonica TaxID=90730 RepID=UPI0006D281A3|nr:ribosome maturation factor RimM [Desulfosarcina cetonica]VTR70863.1 Ribosome maturation factor RimM [Desulfosarcina cetonica]